MNKIVIPAILAAAILVAGFFAYMPVERVSTVHTKIIGQIVTVNKTDDADNNGKQVAIVSLGTGNKMKSGHLCVRIADSGPTTEDTNKLGVNATITTDGEVIRILDRAGASDQDGACTDFTALRVFVGAGDAGDTVDFVAVWKEEN